MKTTIGSSRSSRLLADPFEQLKTGNIRQAQIEHHAVELLRVQRFPRLGTACRRRDLDASLSEQLDDALAFDLVVFDDQQAASGEIARNPEPGRTPFSTRRS